MYCPRCGQQQISDEMKFCSRCGLPMSGLAEWLAGGEVPAARPQETQGLLRSPRRKKIRRAAKLMFISGVLFPVFLVITLIVNEAGPIVVPLLLFFVSLVMMLYARLFIEEIPPLATQQAQSGFGPIHRLHRSKSEAISYLIRRVRVAWQSVGAYDPDRVV
jgi:zinc-ribbon domain